MTVGGASFSSMSLSFGGEAAAKTKQTGYVLCMPSPMSSELFAVFLKTISAAFFDDLCRKHGCRGRRGLFPVAVVVWLMINQRLLGGGTLAMAVQLVAQGAWRLWQTNPCKRTREGKISTNTGGYCQARQKLSTLLVADVADHVLQQLRAQIQPEAAPLFVVDGTTLRLRHQHDLIEAFPPGHNQHGSNHWPMIRMVVFHDAHTGLATRPSWGPLYGAHAVSEQHLAEQALGRLPADAIVIGDANFGIFAFAHAVQQSRRELILRLTLSRAQSLLGTLCNGTHRSVVWKPSRWDRKAHPDLPAEASVKGWVIVCPNPANPSEKLCLFTTMDSAAEDIVALYKMRWNVETDLRSLKRTVSLHEISGKAVAMVEKEILLAVAAYNLVRAIMALAAQRAGIEPRQLSFAGVQAAVLAALPGLDHANTEEECNHKMDRLLRYAAQARLPVRTRQRTYSREIWGRGGHFPFRKSSPLPETTS